MQERPYVGVFHTTALPVIVIFFPSSTQEKSYVLHLIIAVFIVAAGGQVSCFGVNDFFSSNKRWY